jgi:enterochelin esterase-like enzyme
VSLAHITQANPYYDDSYAVNSANLGPYGDALNFELLPFVEKKFRGIAEGWSRALYGGSTGGWESIAVQIFYPDMVR